MIINLLNPVIAQGISSDISDQEVIVKYLESQNAHYFNILYERYSRKVMAKCISLLKDYGKAEDATQDIFVKILLKLSDFSGKSKFSTWLYSITYNYCIDILRKGQKDPNLYIEDYENYEDTEDNIDDREIMETNVSRLKIILNEIPAMDKAVLLMKYQDDMTIRDISDALDKSESAIKMKIKRAKEKFVAVYEEKYKSAS